MKFNNNTNNLCELFAEQARRNPEQPLLYIPDRLNGLWLTRSRKSVFNTIRKITRHLLTQGVGKDAKVAILSATRPEWLECDFGIMGTGAAVVSIYPSLPSNDVGYILHDSGCEIVFAENEEQLQKIQKLLEQDIPIPATEERPATSIRIKIKSVITFENTSKHPFVRELSEILATDESQKISEYGDEAWPVAGITKDCLASLVYTSGTTGPQKGVVQTHGNHLSNIRQVLEAQLLSEGASLFLLLPLAHSFEKLMSYLGACLPVSLWFSRVADTQTSKLNQLTILEDLRNSSATVVPIVPRILEKISEGLAHKASSSALLRLVLANAKARQSQPSSFAIQCLWHALAPVRASIKRKLFGKCFQYCISGGAKLPTGVNLFFDSLGLEILQGYGLTETCVATNCNRPGKNKIGTVGPVLSSDIEIKTLEDGEICFRGPNISKGYFNRTTATAQAWDKEGWFKTGDLGKVRDDGCLEITGRKKELLVTAGGKKIPPERVEFLWLEHGAVLQAFVFGDGKPYLVALIVPNKQVVQQSLDIHDGRDWQALCKDVKVLSEFERIQQTANAQLGSFETIKRFALVPDEFTIENSLLTPTLKLKRPAIAARYKELLESLYLSPH